MGSGGMSGAVAFPAFIEDLHGHLLASTGVDTAGGSVFQDQNFTKPDHDVVELINDAWTANPYTAFNFTDPTTDLAASKAQFDLFYSAVTSLSEDNIGDYITQALLAVTSPTTGQIPDTSVSHDTVEANIAALLGSAASASLGELSLTASTTLWKTVVSAATSELKKCDFPKEVNVLQVVNEAASNARSNLNAALKLAKDLVNTEAAREVVEAFEDRRETTYQSQVSQFAGSMADVNAVNSSAFMFGMAILRSEQMREVSEFNSQLNLTLVQQGLSSYIQMHARQLQVSAQAAITNSSAHNRLLEASIELLSVLKTREEITPAQLLSLYNGLFQTEIAAYLDSDRINKVSKEQRYVQGLSHVIRILTNRRQFENAAATLLTEQNIAKINARSQFEGLTIEDDEREQMWRLNVAQAGMQILAAPSGMAASIPKLPHPALQVAGTAIQGIAAVGQIAGP